MFIIYVQREWRSGMRQAVFTGSGRPLASAWS
jgi:hypothetical protein